MTCVGVLHVIQRISATQSKGYATPAVAAVIGHSEHAHMRGITAAYVGSLEEDVWSRRVEENFDDDSFQINVTDDSFIKRRKIGNLDLTEMCEIAGLDPLDVKDRRKVSKMHYEQTLEDWPTAAKNAPICRGTTVPPSGIIISPSPSFFPGVCAATNVLRRPCGMDTK
jgi:hypothetical protein